MANKIKNVGGAKPLGVLRRANWYKSAGAIYPGDPVKLTSTGQVGAAAASDALCGVALSYASAAAVDVMVADHPDQEFVMECTSATIASQTNLFNNYKIVSGAGNTTYKLSTALLDDTSADASSVGVTYPLKALRLEPRDDNAFGANADVVVIINNHQLKGGTGIQGV